MILKYEFLKIKNTKILIPLILIPLISNIFAAYNYAYNIEIFKYTWYSLWTQASIFYGLIFFPALIGVISGFIYKNEHEAGLNHIFLMPIKISRIIIAKIILTFLITFLVQLFFLLLFFISGKYIFAFSNVFPLDLLKDISLFTLYSLVIVVLMNALSAKIKSFPIVVALSIVFACISFFISTNNIIKLYYFLPNAKISLAMNHLPEKTLFKKDYILMALGSSISCIILYLINLKILNLPKR